MALFDFFKSYTPAELKLRQWLKSVFGIKPYQAEIYFTALRHKSAAKNNYSTEVESNERLEFLGDAVIDAIVAEYLYQKYPSSEEGELTKMKSRIVSRNNLTAMAQAMGVPTFIETDAQAAQSRESISGNTLEALFGAMYLDLGFKVTSQSIMRVLYKYADLSSLAYEEADFKSRIYEAAHKQRVGIRFETKPVATHRQEKQFLADLYFDDVLIGKGEGSSKKRAEQQAARQALEKLNLS